MKKILVIFVAIFGLILNAKIINAENIPVIQLSQADITDIEDTLDNNEIFLKSPVGFESDGKGYFYYLDQHFKTVLKVQKKDFKLVKTISRSGQGPFELNIPAAMKVKNGKIYILDTGFPGIKIFDTDGKPIKEFRLLKVPSIVGINIHLPHVIDVSSTGEIYLRQIDSLEKFSIIVLDINGKKISDMLPLSESIKKDLNALVLETNFTFFLDPSDNIWVIFQKKGILKKFSKQGKLLLERNLYNDLSENERNPKQKLEVQSKPKSFKSHMTLDFMGMAIEDSNRLIVSAYSCGLVYRISDGQLLMKIKKPSDRGFGSLFLIENNQLYTCYQINNLKKIN